MVASKAKLLVVIFIAQLLATILTVSAQISPPLRSRISKPDPKKYYAIRDEQDWQNPKIFVRPAGIEVIGITPLAQGIPAESVPDVLEHLPDSAWPYGLVLPSKELDSQLPRGRLIAESQACSKFPKNCPRKGTNILAGWGFLGASIPFRLVCPVLCPPPILTGCDVSRCYLPKPAPIGQFIANRSKGWLATQVVDSSCGQYLQAGGRRFESCTAHHFFGQCLCGLGALTGFRSLLGFPRWAASGLPSGWVN